MSDIDVSIQYLQGHLALINIPADRSTTEGLAFPSTDPLAMHIFNEGVEVEVYHSESNYN